jgi:murein DD-endopeptidase MepM/ murein hydrolase activator NlpD
MVHPSQRSPLYSPPQQNAWQLTLPRKGGARTYRIRPALVGSLLGLFALVTVAYVGATAYLICRDGLFEAAVSRQVQMQYSYEERIAALRNELDRMTSRHAVQTQGVAEEVATLLQQQDLIERRQSSLDDLVVQARAAGIPVAAAAPLPRARPDAGAASDPVAPPVANGPTDADVLSQNPLARGKPQAALDESFRPVLTRVGSALDSVEATQSTALDALSSAAEGRMEKLSAVLAKVGANVPATAAKAEGGPFIPAAGLHFVERAALLKRTLGDIDSLRSAAAALPLGAPLKARYISSPFGYREDPFLYRPAFHSGLDMVADSGTLVRATAAGTITVAGLDGGYGEMVEIAHAGKLATRYGHLSQILVTRGQHVEAGTPIGRVGSTGRSTGPHLHYELRLNGQPVDPSPYLAAGKALQLSS